MKDTVSDQTAWKNVGEKLISLAFFLKLKPFQGRGSRIFLKRGLTPPEGSEGMPRSEKFFISNALKRYFLHFGGGLTTKYQDQNSDFYT